MPVETSSPRSLFNVQQFSQQYPGFTVDRLRGWLLHRKTNGLDRAVVQVGRLLFLDEAAFFAWLDAQQSSGLAAQGHTMRSRNPPPVALLHLEEGPASPAQWEAWRWLWARLLGPDGVSPSTPLHDPVCGEAPQEEPAAQEPPP